MTLSRSTARGPQGQCPSRVRSSHSSVSCSGRDCAPATFSRVLEASGERVDASRPRTCAQGSACGVVLGQSWLCVQKAVALHPPPSSAPGVD